VKSSATTKAMTRARAMTKAPVIVPMLMPAPVTGKAEPAVDERCDHRPGGLGGDVEGRFLPEPESHPEHRATGLSRKGVRPSRRGGIAVAVR